MEDKARCLLYREMGKIIKRLRIQAGLKQYELARHIGLSRVSMVNIEKGRHKPQIHVLYDLSAALDCSPTDLIPKKQTLVDRLPQELSSKLRKREEGPVAELISRAAEGD